MPRYNATHLWLAAVAVMGWALFIMGCTGWPAWNHDSSKILLPYTDSKTGNASIALVDVNAKRGRILYKCPKDICLVQWTDGERSALVFQPEEDQRSSLISVPINGVEPPRRIASLDKDTFGIAPLPELNGSVYLYGKPSLRVHLASGSVQTLNDFDETMIFPWRDHQLLYVREASSQSGSNDGLEFGEFAAEGTSPHKLFEIAKSDLSVGSTHDLSIFNMAIDANRSRIAIGVSHSGYDDVLVYGRSGLQRVIKLKMPTGGFHLGNMQWSRDGKLLFAAVFQAIDEGHSVWGAGEINVRTGRVRLLPLIHLNVSLPSNDDDPLLQMELSLSPDGRTLAANGALYKSEHIAADDRALYLIDVNKWSREKIVKVPVSAWDNSESE